MKPFSEYNHYRFGKSLSAEVKSKISKSLLGRTLSEEVKLNHSLGARKKKVFCFDWEIDSFLMEFSGIRVMARAIGIRHEYIRAKIDKEKPLVCQYNNTEYKMRLKSSLKKNFFL